MIARRIIPRDQLWPSMRHQPAVDRRSVCRQTIVLDGTEYHCQRAHVDGIHDAFMVHGDGGVVRW